MPFDIKDTGTPTTPQRDPDEEWMDTMDQAEHSEMSDMLDDGLLAEMQKCASGHPETRKHLVPLIRQAHRQVLAAERQMEAEDMMVMAAHHFGLSEERWEGLSNFQKYAAFQRVANKPIMLPMGLTKAKVRDGDGFMVYLVDLAKNNSKFYEGLIVENDDGTYNLLRRWGRLTDSGMTGRIDGAKFDRDGRFRFYDLNSARKALKMHYAKRLQKGYVSAFGPNHKMPDGKKLPMGQYPVGLGAAGFGWGGQSISQCSPVLGDLQDAIANAVTQIDRDKQSDTIEAACLSAKTLIQAIAHQDSSMGKKLQDALGKVLRRLGGSVRFLPDTEGIKLKKELIAINRYIGKQMSLCPLR